MYHKWEEEPISGGALGKCGTFAIFFYGCNMKCIYCQNSKISHVIVGSTQHCKGGYHMISVGATHREPVAANYVSGKNIYTPEELSDLMIKAQTDNCASVSFITGVLYIDKIVETIRLAKEKGLTIPIVYNSSGYEPVSQIKKLDGLIDIYLPDFKYFDNELAKKFSKVNNYPEVAKKCIAEMYRQVALATYRKPIYAGEPCEPHLIVRHLVLPGHTENSKQVIKYLYETYGNDICISIMSQYTPMPNNERITAFPELMRKLTKREYEKVVSYALNLGVKNAFVQEGDVAKESFIPDFNEE